MTARRNVLRTATLVLVSVAGQSMAMAGGHHGGGGGGGGSHHGGSHHGGNAPQGQMNRPAGNFQHHTMNNNHVNNQPATNHRPPVVHTQQTHKLPTGPNQTAPQHHGTKVVNHSQPTHQHHPGNTNKSNSTGIGQLGHQKPIDLHKTDGFLHTHQSGHHQSGSNQSGLGQLANHSGHHANHNGHAGQNGKSSHAPTNLHSMMNHHHSAHSLGTTFGYKSSNFASNPLHHHHHNHGWNFGGYGYNNRWFGSWYYPVIYSGLGYGSYGYPYGFSYSGCGGSYGGYGYCSTVYSPGCYGGVGVATIQPCSLTASSSNYAVMASVAPEPIASAGSTELADATNSTDNDVQSTPEAPLPPLNDLPSFSTTAQDDPLELIPPSPAPPLVPQVVTLE